MFVLRAIAYFKALRIRVIEPSVAAITTKASMIVEWKLLRSGSRRVTGLELRMSPDPQGKLDMGTDDLEQSDNEP